MNLKTIAFVLLAVAACAWSQSAPALAVTSGAAAPPINLCGDTQNVGSIYNRYGDPANGVTGPYFCLQTGAPTLGAGAFTFRLPVFQPATVTTGTISVANGKAAVISNSLTFAGTDATTMTFPSTSATIARTDAAQTFTGVQTFSSSPVIATITNTGTETLPTATGGIPIVIACGNTTTGSGTCANTAVGATAKVYFGNATLASNAQTITISPGFTSSSTFQCLANDQTTRANPVQAVPVSGTTFTVTNTTGASDLIQWACFGY